MIILYRYKQPSDRVYVVAMDDGRSATSATATKRQRDMQALYRGPRGAVQMPSG
jgi:hypothetical protein